MTDTARAAADRWWTLKQLMEMDPEVDWSHVYQLIAEIDPIRKTGQCSLAMDDEMRAKGLY